jgi:hypothetical protein
MGVNAAFLAQCVPLQIRSAALGLHPCMLCEYIYIYISYLSIYKPAGLLSQLDLKQPILLMGTLSVYTSVVAPMYVRQLYIYISKYLAPSNT